MTSRTTRTTAIVAAALVLALALPAMALALPGPTRPAITAAAGTLNASAANATIAAANLRNRIENVLRARKARFDAAAAVLTKNQSRVGALASKVESLGADVSQVRAMLEESSRLLAQAREQEQVCIQAFQGVPEATDRRAAFRGARAEGREAVELMNQARVKLREAARELRRVAVALGEEGDGE
ncbi:MAG: hypothetical protein WBI63_07565 [Coriobacteriia bacterium]